MEEIAGDGVDVCSLGMKSCVENVVLSWLTFFIPG
jgi:hypothetical protein